MYMNMCIFMYLAKCNYIEKNIYRLKVWKNKYKRNVPKLIEFKNFIALTS